MGLIIKTGNPSELLTNIQNAIQNRTVDTWCCDDSGDFTYSPDPWGKRAWFKPEVKADELQLIIRYPEHQAPIKLVSGIYHGRFIEMMVMHFEHSFSGIIAEIE